MILYRKYAKFFKEIKISNVIRINMNELKNNFKKDSEEEYINLFDQFLTIKREFKILISTTLIFITLLVLVAIQ